MVTVAQYVYFPVKLPNTTPSYICSHSGDLTLNAADHLSPSISPQLSALSPSASACASASPSPSPSPAPSPFGALSSSLITSNSLPSEIQEVLKITRETNQVC